MNCFLKGRNYFTKVANGPKNLCHTRLIVVKNQGQAITTAADDDELAVR